MNRLLMWITESWRVWVIRINDRPYIERYKWTGEWQWLARLRQHFGVRYYLHHFASQDAERWIHDHPWRWCLCLVLSGGYQEERFECFSPEQGIITRIRKVRWFNWLNVRTLHRIVSVQPNTWTLIITGPEPEYNSKRKGWGFLEQLPDEDVHSDDPQKLFAYTQPFTGPRTEDFISDMPTGREYREQQDNQALIDWVNDINHMNAERYVGDRRLAR